MLKLMIRIITVLAVTFLASGMLTVTSLKAQSGCYLYNARQYIDKPGKLYGAKADITYSLQQVGNTGFSYHRVAMLWRPYDPNTYRYIEFGWDWSAQHGVVPYGVWLGPSRVHNQVVFTGVVFPAQTHNYQVKYNEVKNQHQMHLDGSFLYGTNSTIGNSTNGIFTVADYAGGGGEVCHGFETMDCIYTFNLQWRKFDATTNTYFWRTWNGHSDVGDDAPYRNYADPNSDPLNSFFTTDDSNLCPLPLP